MLSQDHSKVVGSIKQPECERAANRAADLTEELRRRDIEREDDGVVEM